MKRSAVLLVHEASRRRTCPLPPADDPLVSRFEWMKLNRQFPTSFPVSEFRLPKQTECPCCGGRLGNVVYRESSVKPEFCSRTCYAAR